MAQIDILELAKYFEKSSITRLEYKIDNERLVLEKYTPTSQAPFFQPAPTTQSVQVGAAAPVAAAVEDDGSVKVTAPIVGVFYSSPSPTEPAFVAVGDEVKKGQILCIVEAMKMMNEIVSPCDGVIKAIHCQNEGVVAFGDVLFEVTEC